MGLDCGAGSGAGRSIGAGGGVLAFTLDGSERLFAQLHDRAASLPVVAPALASRRACLGDGPAPTWTCNTRLPCSASPSFSTFCHGRFMQSRRNCSKGEVVFHTVTFLLAADATARDVGQRLQGFGDLRQETPTFWNWLDAPAPKRPVTQEKALLWNVTLTTAAPCSGTSSCRSVSLHSCRASGRPNGDLRLHLALARAENRTYAKLKIRSPKRKASRSLGPTGRQCFGFMEKRTGAAYFENRTT